jgi:beta-phosphoglucomutase-like phosphatase (HAD superfamily)
MLDSLMLGADRDLVKVWQKMNAPRFDKIMLKTKTVGGEATKDGIVIRFEGENGPPEPQIYELTLERLGDGIDPAECVFVDDVDVNCEAARSLGMRAVLYRDADQAMAEVRAALEEAAG